MGYESLGLTNPDQNEPSEFAFSAGVGAFLNAPESVANTMKASGKIQITVWLLGIGGVALFTVLLIRQGLPQVGAAFLAAAGEYAAVVIYHFAVPLFLDALA